MKIRILPLFLLAFIALSFFSCKKIKTPEAEIEREKWYSTFNDSIEYYQQQISEVNLRLDNLNADIGRMLSNFELISNPREVSGYYLLKGWSKKIPFTSTAIYARINENEKLEIIATLAGHTFNRIEVGNCFSEVVPHDQAFNFRHERYNTVYFSGGKADTIAEYISGHKSEKLNLEFIEGARKNSFLIPSDEKDMISQTWELYHTKRETAELQKMLWYYSRKIDTFRRMQDRNEQSAKNKEENA